MLREVLQVLRSEYAFALITASLGVLVALIAFGVVGYLGLAVLGLLTLLVCANVETSARTGRSEASTTPSSTPGTHSIAKR